MQVAAVAGAMTTHPSGDEPIHARCFRHSDKDPPNHRLSPPRAAESSIDHRHDLSRVSETRDFVKFILKEKPDAECHASKEGIASSDTCQRIERSTSIARRPAARNAA